MLKKTFLLGVILTLLLSVFPLPSQSEASSKGFKDVQSNHWAYSTINQAAEKGYFSGYPGNTFRPSNNVTRAEALSVIVRVMGLESNVGAYPFKLDKRSPWAHGSIGAAIEAGIIKEEDYGTWFNPTNPVPRAEVAKWVSNALVNVNSDYKQVLKSTEDTLLPIAEYYTNRLNKKDTPYIAIMMGTGMMGGYTNKEWRPKGHTTRAEMASILLRFENVMKKSPDDFFNLQELIAVGEVGTNMELTTNYVSLPNKTFDKIRNKSISLRKGGGEIYLNRMIVLDIPVNNKFKSIYANMFMGSKSKSFEKSHLVFIEKKLNPSVPVDRNYFDKYYAGGTITPLVYGQRWAHGEEKQLGIKMNPGDFTAFIKDIGKSYYWEMASLSEKNMFIIIKTDDGSEYYILE